MESDIQQAVVQSTRHLFTLMLNLNVDIETSLCRLDTDEDRVISSIQIQGKTPGRLTIIIPVSTAERFAELFTGSTPPLHRIQILDAASEIISMVAGGAAARRQAHAPDFDRAESTLASAGRWKPMENCDSVDLPFITECGEFRIRIELPIVTHPNPIKTSLDSMFHDSTPMTIPQEQHS